MKFFWISKVTGERKEISYKEALERVSENYTEKVCTHEEMLEIKGTIPFMFYNIEVTE